MIKVVSVFFGMVVASIIQSLKGKKPLMNLFREGQKTCKKCGYTYEKRTAFDCPRCAEEKRKNEPKGDENNAPEMRETNGTPITSQKLSNG